jgi:protein SCO1/2
MNRPPRPPDQNARKAVARRPGARALVIAIALVVGFVVAAGTGAYIWRHPQTRQIQRQPPASVVVGGPFSLVDPAGRPVTDQDFRGKFMLIYFGYTTCPNHCPTMLMMTTAALENLGPRAGQVQPIFITVDPEHDTPEIMGRYTGRFSPRILGLTGSPAQVESVATAYGVQTLFRRTGPEEGAYRIDHPSAFYLVGPNGRFIATIQTDGGADDLAAQIRRRL